MIKGLITISLRLRTQTESQSNCFLFGCSQDLPLSLDRAYWSKLD